MHATDADDRSALPPVVTPEEWQQARDALLMKEKRLTRGLDALAAERRRLPVVEFSAGFRFDGPDGSVDLLGLFVGRRQLVVLDHPALRSPGDVGGLAARLVADAGVLVAAARRASVPRQDGGGVMPLQGVEACE